MWTVLWQENDQDRWDRFETKEEVLCLLDQLRENPNVCEDDTWIFSPQAADPTVVKKEEVLGYRIYRYNRKTGTVTFA